MLLTLVRHGEAGSSRNALGDSGRCLTVRGRQQAQATGEALHGRGLRVTHVWTSPLVRAVQTSELILAALGLPGPVEARDHLYPDSAAAALLSALAELPANASVLAVGHMPYMAATASELLECSVSGFSTAEAFHIELAPERAFHATLKWRWAGRFIG